MQVVRDSGNNQPTTNIQETNKNYFCKWQENSKEKIDNNCEIKQIKFDGKKPVLLSDIAKEDNTSVFETTTNEKLKTANTWFLLKIKNYRFNLSKVWGNLLINIDILSTETENKKYTSFTPRFKLKNNQATEGIVNGILVQYKKANNNNLSSALTYCNYKTDKDSTFGEKCDVYKLNSQPMLTNETITNLDLINENKINDSHELQDNNYYIILFNRWHSINAWVDFVIFARKDINSNEQVKFEFKVIHTMTDYFSINQILI